ncbi:uncharacterized protein IL334_001861 [Kwoniella shivajii]|uniref:Xylanolytic transcriptional activator regulatory domain-containing protein n=1 Tax=Kwoniella shivajii TaxID=564305 RepID=A0ABZ1CTC4_9TREE|nr:hypothetical protein IL334_001861 [Kwoniella shivajii]
MSSSLPQNDTASSRTTERLIVKRRRTVKARCQRSSPEPNACTRCTRLLAECTTTQPNRSTSNRDSSTSDLYTSSDLNYNNISKPPPITVNPSRTNNYHDPAQSSAQASPHQHSISLSAHLATEPRILGVTSLSSLRDEISVSYGSHSQDDASKDDEYDLKAGGIRREMRLHERELSFGVIEQLLSDFATHISPLNPILSSNDIFSPARMSVVTISAVCAVASLSRTVPASIFLAAKDRLVNLLDQSDILKVASVANIQALLVATSKAELLMNQRQSSGGSLSFQRCSSAIRMAQELGLHRTEIDFPPDVIRRRQSTWRSCLIADRWLAAGYGLPQIIDLDDCNDVYEMKETDPQMILQAGLFQVSTLLGRVLKEIYTPKILTRTNDDRIERLITDIDQCRSRAHDILRFDPSSDAGSVVFELSILTVEALFLRGVTSKKVQLPSHVAYRASPGRWKAISERSQMLVVWIEEKGDWLLDTTRIGLYGMTFCSLMMFREYSQYRSPGALHGLHLASRATSRWAEGNGDITYMTPGRKHHSQIIRTLYLVARDGTRGSAIVTGERLHVVSPLAEGKNRSSTSPTTFLSKQTPATISVKHSPLPLPTELEVGHSLLQLTNDRENMPQTSEIPPLSDTFPIFGSSSGFDSAPEEAAWAPMDNWLSEMLDQDGVGWSF